MFEMIRKSLLASLGAAVVTREKVEEATRRWVDEGKISREEAERLAQDLVESGQQRWEEIQKKIQETGRKAMDSLDVGSRQEFQELRSRVETLERKVAMLQERGQAEKE